MPRRDTDNIQFALLSCIGMGGNTAGWFLPAPASYVGIVIGTICIGGMLVLRADLRDKIKEERRKLLRHELRERSRRGPDA